MNSLLGQELKIEDLDSPFSEFPKEIYQKQLTELVAYQQQVEAHIKEKKRNYSQTNNKLNTIAVQQENKLKNLILPLTLGTAGTVAGIVALKYWLSSSSSSSSRTKGSKITYEGVSPNIPSKIKLLAEQYSVNLKKLQKNGYSTKLAQTIQENFRQIQTLTEQWLAKQKNVLDEKK